MTTNLRLQQLGLTLMALLVSLPLIAQDYRYSVYIDVDSSPATGCSDSYPNAPGQTVGAEIRLTAVVDGNPAQVQQVLQSDCNGGVFGPETQVGGGYPVALNGGLQGTDSVELALPDLPSSFVSFIGLRFEVAAQTQNGNEDLLLTTDGGPDGGPIVLNFPSIPIPTLGIFGALLLALVLIVVAWRTQKKWQRRTLLSVGLLLGIGSSAAAASLIADGNLLDWDSITPLASDPEGDSTNSDEAADLRAFFAEQSAGGLIFRIDITDVENRPPEADPQSVTTLEDDAVVITLTANDADSDPLTFAIDTAPTRGALGPVTPLGPTSASVTYTPNADENGVDSFTFLANDGVIDSPSAAISIDITAVNDAPGFSASSPQAVNEDAGPQALAFAGFNAGPANESAQAVLTYIVSDVTNPVLFAAGPTIGNDGTLSYTTAPDANGSSSFTVVVQDDGGTLNGGLDTSAPQTFSLSVNPVNDIPSFSVGPDQVLNEDAGPQLVDPWATALSSGPADEAGQNLLFDVTDNSNPDLFSVPPSVTPDGALSYTLADNASGTATITLIVMDDGGTANGGVDSSDPQTFTITVASINDAPSFVAGPDQVIDEDAGPQLVDPWASAIDDGDPELTQNLSFEITANSNPALFSAAPSVSPTGALSYTPADDGNGSATITLRLIDDGGTANGGVDTSATQDFTITVNPVNDQPVLTAVDPVAVLEDSGAQVVPAWATFSPGPANEAGQSLIAYQVTSVGNPALFATLPSVSNDGTLSYTPAADINGSSTFTVTVQDDGGTVNGGNDTSDPQVFTISVTAVNDAPSFIAGPDITIDEDAGAQLITPWATGLSAGPVDESSQGLTFEITANTNPVLFGTAPAVAADGSLSFAVDDDISGEATITLRVVDNGGTVNGGVDRSPTQDFTITINPVNDAPLNSVPGAQTVDEDSVLLFDAANTISVGDIDIDGGTITVELGVNDGELDVVAAGAAIVMGSGSAAVTIDGTLAEVNATLASLSYTPDAHFNDSDTLSVLSDDNGNSGSGGPQTDLDSIEISVAPVNDAPVNTVPGSQTVAGGMLEFSTANGNAISVADVDADPGTIQVDLLVTDGTLNAVEPTPGVVISNNTSAAVTLVGLQADINTALDGLLYVPNGGGTDTLTVLSDDLGNTGAGGPLIDSDTVTILVDAPPTVTVTPANGATVRSGTGVQFSFSEAVDLQAGAVSLACLPSGAGITANPATNTIGGGFTSGNPTNTGQPGDTCTLTIISTLVTDTDLIDPPNELDGDNSGDSVDGDADNFVSSYTVDTAPVLVSTSPMTGATVSTTAVAVITFDEPVDFGMGGFTLDCGGGSLPVTPSGSGTDTLTFTPNAPLPEGSSCTATLLAANVDDSDTFDPPANPATDVVVTFNVDAEPVVVSTLPADTATQVATGTTVSFTFSESVDASGAAITLNCAGSIAGTVSGSGSNTLTFTPSAALPEDTACTATAVAANISDSDAIDPPDSLPGDVAISFTTDAAPTVVNTVPPTGATLQPPTDTITINFSESVNFDTTAGAGNTSFDLECPAATPAGFTVITASPAASVVIDPLDLDVTGETCVLTIRAAGITDADAGDPPDSLPGDVVVSIGYDDPAIANDDSYAVTPHLFLAIGSAGPQGGGVLSNDTIGTAAITGFGPIGSCAAVMPNGSNFITTGGGGRVILGTDGSFSYAPPAGLVGNGTAPSPEDGFCYSITGGDTANVGFELQFTEQVWFVDASYGGANGTPDGTQARPFTDLVGAGQFATAGNAGGTSNDAVFIAQGTYACNLDLLPAQSLIGDGVTGGMTLVAFTGVPPVPGAAYPAFSGVRPMLQAVGADCITLGTNNLLRGFNIGNSARNIVGSGFLAFDIREMALSGAGQGLDLVNGTTDIQLDSITANNSPSHGINIDNVAGQFTVTGATVIDTTGPGGAGVRINASTGNFNFDTINVDRRVSAGLQINASRNVTTGALTINNQNVSNTSAIAIDNTAAAGTITVASATVNNNGSNSSAAAISGNAGTVSINGGTFSNAAGATLSISSGSGNVTVAANISNSAGRSVQILNNTGGVVTHSGTINHTVAEGVVIQNNANTAINLSGSTKSISSGANSGVNLVSNAGSTINFSNGGLTIASTSGPGFSATGGGTVTVQGSGNALTTTTGTPLAVLNTQIGAAGLNFRSISANGAANGINLSATGVLGGLSVTGDGSNARNGSGGTIQSTVNDGILLDNAFNISLSSMELRNIGDTANSLDADNPANDHAIQSTNAGSISLRGVHVDTPIGSGWEARNLSGTNLIGSDSLFEDINTSNFQAVHLRNTDTNLDDFSILASTFRDQADTNGSSYLLIESIGSSDLSINVNGNSLFTNLFGYALQISAGAAQAGFVGTGTVTTTIQGSQFTAAQDGTIGLGATGGIGGIAINARESSTHNFSILGNTFNDIGRPLSNGAIISIDGIGGTQKTIVGTIQGNDIDRIGYPTAAAATTTVGHRVIGVVTENDIERLDVQVLDNEIDDTSREALFVSSRDASGNTSGQFFDVLIQGNQMGQVQPIGMTNREAVEVLSEDSSRARVAILDNFIRGNTSSLDQVVDIDVENTSIMSLIMTGNTVTNAVAGADEEIVIDTESGTSNLCLRFLNNTALGVEFNVNGTFQVEDFANIGTNNPGVGAFVDGIGVTPVAGGTCMPPNF